MSTENKIKEALEKNTFQPSPEAWVKLQSMLDEHQQISLPEKIEDKPAKKLYIYGIAASLFAILALVYFLVQPSLSHQTVEPGIVQEKTPLAIPTEVELSAPVMIDHKPNVVESIEKKVAYNQPVIVKKNQEAIVSEVNPQPKLQVAAQASEKTNEPEETQAIAPEIIKPSRVSAEQLLYAVENEQSPELWVEDKKRISAEQLLGQAQKETEAERRNPELIYRARNELRRLQTAVLDRNY